MSRLARSGGLYWNGVDRQSLLKIGRSTGPEPSVMLTGRVTK